MITGIIEYIVWYSIVVLVFGISVYGALSNAQQSCVPATAPKRKVAKLHFVYPSNLYLYTIFRRMQLKVWRIENLHIEGSKSKSGGSKFEVQMVQNRGSDGFLAALRTARRSWDHPEGVVVRLGGVLEPSWGRFGCVLGLEAVLGASWSLFGGTWGYPRASWRFEWRLNEAFHFACRLLIDFDRLLLPKIMENHRFF